MRVCADSTCCMRIASSGHTRAAVFLPTPGVVVEEGAAYVGKTEDHFLIRTHSTFQTRAVPSDDWVTTRFESRVKSASTTQLV